MARSFSRDYTFPLMAKPRHTVAFPPRPVHGVSRLHRGAAHPPAPRARARHDVSLPRPGEVPLRGRRVGRGPRRGASRHEGAHPPRRRRHHVARPRTRGVAGEGAPEEPRGLLPPRRRLRPRGRARRGHAHQRGRHEERPRIPGGRAFLRAPRLRLDGLRLGHRRRHVSRDRPRRRAELQEFLRGDEVPRRGGREGERPSRRDLPARNRGRQFEDGGDGEVRRPLLLLERDGRAPVARRFHQGGNGRRGGEPRPRGLRARGDRPPLDVGRARSERPTISRTRALRPRSRSRRCSRRRSGSRSSTCRCRSSSRSCSSRRNRSRSGSGCPSSRSTTSTIRCTTTRSRPRGTSRALASRARLSPTTSRRLVAFWRTKKDAITRGAMI